MTSSVTFSLAVLPLLFVFFISADATIFSKSLQTCQEQCIDRNLVLPLSRGSLDWDEPLLVANLSERTNACHIGCQDLESVNSTCDERCNHLVAIDSCMQGCRAVTDIFLHQIQDLLYHVSISIDGEDAQGISTTWKFDEVYGTVISEISATDIQWAVHSRPFGSGSPWQITVLEEKAFKEDSMQSKVVVPSEFASEIEVRLCIFWRSNMVVSRPIRQSIVGVGGRARAPKLIAQLQLSSNSYVICWSSPLPRVYKVSLYLLDGTLVSSTETTDSCYLFKSIPTENCCRANIGYASISEAALDVAVKLELTTTNDISLESVPQLVFTNGTSILKLYDVDDYVVLTDPKRIPFDLGSGRTITALCSISIDRILVALDDGSIFWVSIVDSTNGLVRPPDGVAITHLEVDYLQQKVYAVLHKKGIVRCDLTDCDNSTTLTTNSVNFIEYISVDSWNGFIYCITNGGEVFSAPLFPLYATSTISFSTTEQISDASSSFALEVDMENSQLIFVSQNGSILSMSTINRSISDLRSSYELSDQYKSVIKAHFAKNRMFWTSSNCGESHPWDSCLYSEEWDSEKKKIHLNRYLYAGRVVDFTFLRNGTLPPTLLPPSTIGLMTSADSALVTWDAPISMPFQAKGVEWRNLRYECRVMNENDEESAKAELTHLDGTSLAVTVSPGIQYHATVRVCVMSICSPFASAINSAFAPFNDPPFVLFNRTDTGVDFFDPLGLPLDKYELDSPLPIEPTSPFAIDPTTQWLYAIETDESTIFRIRRDGSKLRFLDTVTVHFLAVLPKYALIIVASDYLILSYRLTSSLDQVIYSCEAANNCGEVAGVAADDQSGDIFFLIQNLNGTTSLFGLNQEIRTPYLIASSTDFPPIRQLVVAKEKLAFITKSGNMGVCDKKLGSLNFNMALARVSLLTSANMAPINALNFTGEIGFVDDSPSNLSWSIDPTLQQGKAIYKISMFKERWGGERFVDISMEQNYVMSTALLEQWPSRQKFDVQIDAITAWNVISANQTGLYAPTKPPLPPNNLRIYATQQKTVDGARALIDLFWDEPVEWNGDQVGYVVNCSVDNTDQRSERVPPSVRTYSFSVKSGRVSCEVAASNDPAHETFSEPITIDSSELRPLVRLFAVNSSFAVIAVSNWSSTSSIRSKRQNTPPSTIIQQVIAFIGSELYAIRKDSDSAQPFLIHLDMTKIESILHKVSIGGEVSAVDAVISDWLANRLLFVSSGSLMQVGLDGIQGLSVVTPRRLMDLSPGAGDAKQLLYDPFTNTAYLLTKNGSLFALYLTKGVEENLALRLDCLKSETITSMMSEFAWNRAISPAIYVLTWNGMLRVDIIASKCEEIHFDWAKFGEKGLKSVSSFAIADKLFVFVTSSELIVYELSSSSATPVSVAGAPFKQVLAVSQSSQPYPDRSCFALPESPDIKFTVENEERSGAIVTINEPPLPNSCPGVSVPPTQYEIHFKRRGTDKIRNIRSISHIVHIDDGVLDKEADYDVTVSWFNRFSPPSPPSEPQTLRTGYGFPSSPQEPAVFALTPDTVLLYWKLPLKLNAPIPEIKYRISQLSASLTAPATIGAQQFEGARYSASPTDVVSCLNNPCSAKISNLRPSTDYKFWIRAVHESHLNTQFSEDSEAVSMEISTRTKDICGTLRPDNVTGTSLVLRWNSLQPESPPSKISIQYRISGADAVWKSPYNASFDWSDKSIAIVISALRSATTYDYRFAAEYSQSYHYGNRMYPFAETYYQNAQQIKTKPGTPSAPASVVLVHENDQWIVRWQKPLNDGGSPITSYALEYRPKENAEWEIAERGIEGNSLWWKPPRANFVSEGAEFRIRAANSEGFGAYAYSRQHESSSEGAETSSSIRTILVVLLVAIVLLIAVIGALFLYYQYAAKKEPKTKSRDIGLQTFKNGTQNGALPPQIANDLKSIPRVEKRFVSLSRMIGKGSFGEVFEGVACGLPQSPTKGVRVAIKTLKSGYSESDRLKFLKEAILMNNFDHPNIVKLMGVSLESEPYYLIIELMEGGDLLGFLRSSRPSDCLPSQLSLCELIDMMVDVGRGGTYLEANRHVHRDLAARNCLISSRNSYTRVTKIADFGLARDVYTNDYYRVHGEDFLPLRWLAPESITDGVFTSKSDVWSFGVLLWEILTLGQQPYIGKHNVQVMSFVKGGGRPEKPPYCPDEIFNIVERAWIYDPEKRPGFADLLPELEALRGNPAYQDDSAFPPLCILVAASNFDLSMDSNISVTESAERSGSMRFDKSDNPSTKKQGRPSILRSLRKERPKPPPSREELEGRTTSSRGISLISSETLSTALESDYTTSGKGIDNEGFISSDYYGNLETPTRRISTTRSMTRIKSPAPLPPPIITEHNSSSNSPPSSSHSPSPQDSPSIFVRPARVSRV